MRVRRAATLLVLLCTTGLLHSPQGQQKGHQVVTNTRLEIFFSELETQWLKAVQDKNPAALNRVVSDDFHLWTAENPVSRAEWLLGVFGRNLQSFQLRRLAARQVSPEIAVVSFVQTETYQSGTPQTADHFVVDIWINSGSGDNWRCTDRYFSEVSAIPLRR